MRRLGVAAASAALIGTIAAVMPAGIAHAASTPIPSPIGNLCTDVNQTSCWPATSIVDQSGADVHGTLPAVEKLAKEFDIRVAIHTHGPEDAHFPSPKVVLDAVKTMDPRMGLCLDVGHSMRTGADLVQEIANAGPRLLDMHMKDLKVNTEKGSQCDVGDGVMPVVAIFKQLKKMGYKGIDDVRQGKYFEIALESANKEEAQAEVERIAKEVLTNPVIEEYRYTLEG